MANEQVSGEGAGGNTPGGSGNGTNTGGNNAPGGGQQPVAGRDGAGGQQNGPREYTFKEDRSDWLPRTRYNEVNTRATEAQREVERLKQELETRDGRIRALAGVEKPDAKQQEADELRSLIYSLVPEIGALKGLTQEQLSEVLEAAREARGATSAGWSRHRDGVVGQMNDEAAKVMGVDKLTDTQAGRLLTAFRSEAQDCVEARRAALKRGERETLQTQPGDTDFVARYEAGDKTLIQGFVKSYLDDFYTPARRNVEARVQNRNRPVPSGTRVRQLPATGEQKQDLNTEEGFKKALLAARSAGERE